MGQSSSAVVRTSGPVSTRQDVRQTPKEKKWICFKLFSIQTAFITLVVVDLLLISHSIIFILSNHFAGAERYSVKSGTSSWQTASVLPYSLLFPLFVAQVVWLLTCALTFLSIKFTIPYLLVPYFFTSLAILVGCLWVLVTAIHVVLGHGATSESPYSSPIEHFNIDWTLVAIISVVNLVLLLQICFIYVKFSYFRFLVRRRKAVAMSEPTLEFSASSNTSQRIEPLSIQLLLKSNVSSGSKIVDDTYSTQSTVLVVDGADESRCAERRLEKLHSQQSSNQSEDSLTID